MNTEQQITLSQMLIARERRAQKQQELLRFLEDSARFFGCQFIMATHSPFLLSMRGAKIYDMDEEVVDVKRWSELANVRAYYTFFKEHEKEFW